MTQLQKLYGRSWRSIVQVGVATAILLLMALPVHSQDGDTFCWRDNFGRGAGVPLSTCGKGQEKNGALCYPLCEAGFSGNGPVCWSNCPEGFIDDGATCRKPGDIQAKVSYPRSAGQAMVCGAGREQQAGLCYASCGEGWRGEAKVCYQDCPSGFRDDGLYCGKPEPYGRGAGYAAWDMAICERDNGKGNCEFSGALIYPKCKANYRADGCCVCSPNCPAGWEDIGVSCKKPSRDRGVGTAVDSCPPGSERDGALCYPTCKAGYKGAGPACWSQCPEGYQDDGATCRKDPLIVGKQSKGRGAGVAMICAEGLQQSGALCYPPCGAKMEGIGPVCWGRCPSSMPYDCGAACAVSEGDCIDQIQKMLIQGAKMAIDVITFGGSTAMDVKDAMNKAAEATINATSASIAGEALGSTAEHAVPDIAKAGLKAGVEATLKKLLLPFDDVMDLTNMNTYADVGGLAASLEEASKKSEGGLTGGNILALMSTKMTPAERDALITELALEFEDEQVIDPYDIVSQFPLTNPFGILDFVDTFRKGSCSEYPDNSPSNSGGLQAVYQPTIIGTDEDGMPIYQPTWVPNMVITPQQYKPVTLGVLLSGDSKPSGFSVIKVAKAATDQDKIQALLGKNVDPALLAEITARFKSGKLFGPGTVKVQARSAPSTATTPAAPATAASSWQAMDGQLVTVSSDAQNVWGVNAGGEIFRRAVDGSGNWEKVCCSLSDVSASGKGWVWGVQGQSTVWKCAKPCAADGSGWKQVDGTLVHVSGGETHVWGVNAGGEIFRRPVDGSGSWEKVCCSLSDVSASGKGWVWGVQGRSTVWKCAEPCAADGSGWKQVDGTFVQVLGGEKHVWGVNAAGEIWKRPIDGSASWERVPGVKMKRLTASGSGWVWGVNDANAVFKFASGD